jgi:hypothetical protein
MFRFLVVGYLLKKHSAQVGILEVHGISLNYINNGISRSFSYQYYIVIFIFHVVVNNTTVYYYQSNCDKSLAVNDFL